MKITLTEASSYTRMTWRTIRKRVQEAGLQPIEHSKKSDLYDSKALLPLLYQRKVQDGLDLSAERAKLAIEQTRKLQRENDAEDARLAPVEDLEAALESVTGQMIPLLEALPGQIRERIPNLGEAADRLVQARTAQLVGIAKRARLKIR